MRRLLHVDLAQLHRVSRMIVLSRSSRGERTVGSVVDSIRNANQEWS
jgi:hypothetical protein